MCADISFSFCLGLADRKQTGGWPRGVSCECRAYDGFWCKVQCGHQLMYTTRLLYLPVKARSRPCCKQRLRSTFPRLRMFSMHYQDSAVPWQATSGSPQRCQPLAVSFPGHVPVDAALLTQHRAAEHAVLRSTLGSQCWHTSMRAPSASETCHAKSKQIWAYCNTNSTHSWQRVHACARLLKPPLCRATLPLCRAMLETPNPDGMPAACPCWAKKVQGACLTAHARHVRPGQCCIGFRGVEAQGQRQLPSSTHLRPRSSWQTAAGDPQQQQHGRSASC
jgi:hypothetical protein